MKFKSIWIVVIYILSFNVFSQDKNTFLNKWMATPTQASKTQESKILKRYISIDGHLFPVATITYFRIHKNDKKLLEKDLYSKVQKAFGGKDWKSFKNGKNQLVEGFWPGGNRYLRWIIHEDNESLLVTFANMRMGYKDTLALESQFIQEALVLSKTKLKKTSWINNLINVVEQAHANDYGGLFGNLPTSAPGLGDSTAYNPSDLADSLDNFSSSFDQLAAEFQLTNQNMADANTNLNAAVGEVNKANTNWGDTNEIMDRNWQESNRQYARTNDLAEKMTDPNHMFKLAAATSAGAVFGATLANLAIDGVVAGARWVVDLITDASGKKDRWEKFEMARKGWEETVDNARKLEKLLDDFLLSQELMTQIRDSLSKEEQEKLTRENLVSYLSRDIRKLKKQQKKLEKEFEDTDCVSCENELAGKLDDMEKVIATGTGLKSYLDDKNFKIYNEELFCDQLINIMRKLGEAEAQLQSYRLNILNARVEWAEKNEDRTEELFKTVARLNKEGINEKFYKQRVDNAEEVFEGVEDSIEAKKKAWIRNCESSDPKWKEQGPFEEEEPRSNWPISKKCKKDYERKYNLADKGKLDSAKQTMEKKITLALRDMKASDALPVEVNAEAEDQRLLAHYQWFKDLEEQQYCFTNPQEKKCKDLGQIKFMGPFYVKDKAKVKLQDICHKDTYDY